MSSWSMNDGSALSGAYTFTNASAIVQGNSSADTTEIKVGDIVIDDNGLVPVSKYTFVGIKLSYHVVGW